ncbi:MerR family transcriptional regulator [Amycolatopsis cihanbeyliensis]|uniref:MerR family transcriptional regulator n=1 Tax=Amycolatopsis cihanbeyliensis TaxID=1128664 RepID=A0A542DF71_AMYCI|nr:MerR family transcriptional regulator [Amycolatopsis cihanbeyliensis]TQJ01700.1 MerR family transcriptional regulator [Amycolatopsis cihanbeyliensis]
MGERMQIGEVAERTGLSLRTIRYYEEVGLVVPSARSQGGFRLYTEPDLDRLQLTKRMKPLGFQLEEIRELLTILAPTGNTTEVEDPVGRLAEFSAAAERACDDLRDKLHAAEEFALMLRTHKAAAGRKSKRQATAARPRR